MSKIRRRVIPSNDRRLSATKHALPRTPSDWLNEIKLAIEDAGGAESCGRLTGQAVADPGLFHLAPLVCLKFRGRKLKGPEAKRVTEVALANYVANSNPQGIDHGLEQRPTMAFALCYVTAHMALGLVTEGEAEAVLIFCEEHFDRE